MNKLFINAISITMLAAMLVQTLPSDTIKISFPSVQQNLPAGAYSKDATWADNSPATSDLPPDITFDGDPLAEYEYTPRAERSGSAA
ncbi:MAG: hypothetical protein FWF18_05340, partial [Dehalococcoidia bacterium]|nr:hypothetical protein [Dehalococcoidia bacterium]